MTHLYNNHITAFTGDFDITFKTIYLKSHASIPYTIKNKLHLFG
ncbi:hypothetical protein SAMN04488514_101171 [Kriegella aquimaris]|uniref:Uncharacterized protein n=1 Tax=Kriegella aquimaris TaxID=192904 RepID=A0A1G9IJX3_9FLAO|nr:hypothetical protein SAMN04488514_101171 [Kriegella aquimaris]